VDIERPRTLDGTLAAIGEYPNATLLAGGTDVMVEVNFRTRQVQQVISLRQVTDLKEWNGNRIGAGVTFQRMERGPIRALAQLARTVGSPQIRSVGTLGGNLGTASPAGDSHPFLAACDAGIEVRSRTGETRTLRWNEFLTGPKMNALQPGEVITAAVLPEHLPARQEFGKVGVRSAMVISTVSACVMRDEDGRTTAALGAVGPTVLRATRAEEMISAESHPSEESLAEFARLVSEEVRPITDHRSTAAYRRHAAGVLARRLLERCLAA
jgi:CO/xanthine dehydrogenase FAD-binding subunit